MMTFTAVSLPKHMYARCVPNRFVSNRVTNTMYTVKNSRISCSELNDNNKFENYMEHCITSAGFLLSSLALCCSAYALVPDDSESNVKTVYDIRPPRDKTITRKHTTSSLVYTDDGSASFLGKYPLPKVNSSSLTENTVESILSSVKQYVIDVTGESLLQLKETSRVVNDNTIVSYVQTIRGIPIEGTYAIAQVKDGFLQYARYYIVSTPDVQTEAKIPSNKATEIAIQDALTFAKNAIANDNPRLTVIYNDQKPVLAWAVPVITEQPYSSWKHYIDADSGTLIFRTKTSFDAVKGNITYNIEPSCQGDVVQQELVPYVQWRQGQYTDINGSFNDNSNSSTSKVQLNGQYFRIREPNERQSIWNFDLRQVPFVNQLLLRNASLSHTDPYFYASKARSWLVQSTSGINIPTRLNSWINSRVTINVDKPPDCNARYDPTNGSMHFYLPSGNCNNSGRVSKIVYHEYGHGIHDHSSSIFDSQVSEGVADYVSSTITNDPNLTGLVNCNTVLSGRRTMRTCVNQYTYCDGIQCTTHPGDEPHEPAPVICGALWELRNSLINLYGQDIGTAKADKIFIKFLSLVTDMNSSYTAAIAADDDTDGNPGNGTVHSCEINKSFIGNNTGDFAHFPQSIPERVPCVQNIAIK